MVLMDFDIYYDNTNVCSTELWYLLTAYGNRECGRTKKGLDRLKCTPTGKFSGIDQRGEGSISLGAPLGAETAGDLAMDDRRPQSAFRDIVGRLDIRAIEADEQVGAMGLVTALQLLGSGWRERAQQQPVAQALQ